MDINLPTVPTCSTCNPRSFTTQYLDYGSEGLNQEYSTVNMSITTELWSLLSTDFSPAYRRSTMTTCM